MRCAALLDSRRAPRGSPPAAEVLVALQEQIEKEHHRHRQQLHARDVDGGDSTIGCSVACLGLLVLEGSSFLVNRALLLRRLDGIFSTESTADTSSWGVAGETTQTRGAGAGPAAFGASSGRTNEPAPPASSSGAVAGQQRQGRRRTFALVDVRKSLALPCERSDALAPRLNAALRSAFGSTVADGVDHPPPRGGASNIHGGSVADETAMGGRADRRGEDGEGEGARWLRDWGTKELGLDCEGLRETLGDVGLCGLAGWLLEYPVVYCCLSQAGSPDGADRAVEAEGGATTANVMGNCLAGVPLTVYSLSVDLGNEKGSGSPFHVPREMPSDTSTGTSLQAFSFSVPERVCGPAGAEGGEEGVTSGLQGLVDGFLGRMEARMAQHRSSSSSSSDGYSCQRQKQLVFGLNVSKRTETLDRVAL